MDEIETAEDVLRRAIQNEIESGDTYVRASNLVRDRRVREGLRMAAQEERRHQAALERLLANWERIPASFRQLAPGTVWPELTGEEAGFLALEPDATFVEMCLFARRKEQLAYASYRALAEQSEGEIRNLFEIMAQEELEHERMFRYWYERAVGQEPEQ